jgi:hypothetical protein
VHDWLSWAASAHYLLHFLAPNNAYILLAQRTLGLQPAAFYTSIYTGLTRKFRTAYLRACPYVNQRTCDINCVSSHLGCKWILEACQSERLIADVGHCHCTRDAAHLYFNSTH